VPDESDDVELLGRMLIVEKAIAEHGEMLRGKWDPMTMRYKDGLQQFVQRAVDYGRLVWGATLFIAGGVAVAVIGIYVNLWLNHGSAIAGTIHHTVHP
jgi:hypothetical protein